MTYNPLIPGPNDVLSQSQSDIQDNFSQLNTLYDLDHFAFDDTTPSFRGLHKYLSFPFSQPTNPSLGSLAAILFPRTKTGSPELFFKNSTDYTQITSGALPIWKGGTPTDTGVVGGTNFNAGPYVMGNGHGSVYNYGNIILPTGLEFKWGWVIPTAGAVNNLNFTYPTPFATQTINVQIIPIRNDGHDHSITIQSDISGAPDVSANRFTLSSDSSGWAVGFYYFAIGN